MLSNVDILASIQQYEVLTLGNLATIFISIHKTESISLNGINYSPICSLGNKKSLIKSKNLPFSLRYYITKSTSNKII